MVDMRTPLGKVRGLGSAKEGTDHFWRQRLTAIANVPLITFFVTFLIAHSNSSYAEVRAALGAAHRNHEMSDRELAAALEREQVTRDGSRIVELDPTVEALARAVAIRQGLKGADAVHLASALVLGEPELVFATFDRRLHAAARAEGLIVAPVAL